MKKIITFVTVLAAFASANAQDERVVLDLNNPANPTSLVFNEQGYWTETYNEADYTYIEFPPFAFSHLTGGASWGGTYWDGFTVSKSTTKAGWYSNVAGGGMDGADDPYLVGYWPEYAESEEEHPTEMIFDNANNYRIEGVYVNNIASSYKSVSEGDDYARKFDKEGDSFKLIANGVGPKGDVKTASIELAGFHDGEFSALTDWTYWDLSSLGRVESIYFTMSSTDVGDWGINTGTYFALSKMIVSKPKPTGIDEIEVEAPVVNVKYYNLAGIESNSPFSGLNIVVKTRTDGSKQVTKVIK